ncbi:MAG: aspartyl protease family protein [Verrucomicrobia bacterium]|nr:aspartyl protease family protein [Verrucomicrobiota bacterium]
MEAGIQGRDTVYRVRLLLDSGADCTMLPKSMGELAGVDFSRLRRLNVTGVEGRGVKAYLGMVHLQIAGLALPPIPCLYGSSDKTPLLLGREGFFDLFDVKFDNRRKRVVLTQLF